MYTLADRMRYRRLVYSRIVSDAFTSGFQDDFSGSVLDIGCGSGLISRIFKRIYPQSAVTGIDKDANEVRKARTAARRQRLGIKYAAGDITRLPFRGSSFDAVAAGLVFFEMEPKDRMACLREIHRVLKRGGRLLLIEGTGMQDFAGQMRKAGFVEPARIETATNDIYDAVK